MKRLFILTGISLFIFLSVINAMDLSELFNTNNSIKYEGTSLIISGVPYGGNNYWGKWELQNDLSFKLTDAGQVFTKENDIFFDTSKACQAILNSYEISKDDLEGSFGKLKENLNISDCLYFYKSSNDNVEMFCCKGNNFLRILGKKIGETIIILNGFEVPLYFTDGSSYNGKFIGKVYHEDNTTKIGEFEFYFNIFVKKLKDKWIEVFTSVNNQKGNVYYREIGLDYSWGKERKISGNLE